MSQKGKLLKSSFTKRTLYRLILDFVFQHPDESVDYKKIAKSLGVTDVGGKRLIHEVLYELVDDGFLTEISTGKFKAGITRPTITGVLELTSRGRAYVISEESKKDIRHQKCALFHHIDSI